MKLLAHVHKYPPLHNAGAEWMLHSILRWMRYRGHDARVIVRTGEDTVMDGIAIKQADFDAESYEWADIVLTHLDLSRHVIRYAATTRRPVVHIVHNDNQLRYFRVKERETPLVVFNSRWLQKAVRWEGASLVVHPPVFASDYLTKRGRRITLVNLSPAKGCDTFWRLADALPDHKFLAVKGAYAEQIVPLHVPRNVRVMDNTPDARSIYAQTRVLLMPSAYESWGRCAVEAAVSGVPVIAHPCPGLVEALGPTGIFCDRNTLADWIAAVRMLDDQDYYDRYSLGVQERVAQFDPDAELVLLEKALEHVTHQPLTSRRVRQI